MLPHPLGPVSEEIWHSFKLDHYANHLSHGPVNSEMHKSKNPDHMYFVKSDPIEVGGLHWQIRIYPNYYDMDVYLYLLDDIEAVKKFSFIFLTTYYSSTSSWQTNSCRASDGFDPTGFGFDYDFPMVKIGSISYSTSSDMRRDNKDCMWFKLGLQVEMDSSKMVPSSAHPAAASPPKENPNQSSKVSPSGSSVMGTLLVNGDFADVTFDVNGQTFAAHRCVLAARSSVFRSELVALKNDMSKSDVCVSVKHTDAHTFKYLLHFIYTDSLHPDFNNEAIASQTYVSLLIAAHHFNVEGLKLICAEKLPKGTAELVISTLKITEDLGSGLLEVLKKG